MDRNECRFASGIGAVLARNTQATSHPAVFSTIERKLMEAFCEWAFMKMGVKRRDYLVKASQDFAVLCALRSILTGRSIEDVANELPFELPLKLTKKRTGFLEMIPKLYGIAAEYEMVCEVAKAAKTHMLEAAQFRCNLRGALERFAEQEDLKPAPTRYSLDRLIKNYGLRTRPSEIAATYVGKRHATSAANIKKLVGLVRDPKRMQKTLGKYLKSAYLPPNFDEIKRSLTKTESPPSK